MSNNDVKGVNRVRCPNCHAGMQSHQDKHGLTTWSRNENGEVTVNLGTFLPVITYICPSCNDVRLQVDKDALS